MVPANDTANDPGLQPPLPPPSRRRPASAWIARQLDDVRFLGLVDRSEQTFAKVLGLLLVVVMAAATLQLLWVVGWSLLDPNTPWLERQLMVVLGDLLNLLIAVEVLQNITSYLRRHVVQIELVLVTAMTAVARKVIVLPQGAEGKPLLLMGLGVAVLALAAAYWLVLHSLNLRREADETERAKPSPDPDR
jgi:uncharacterized membrane protein (DUF373 family)